LNVFGKFVLSFEIIVPPTLMTTAVSHSADSFCKFLSYSTKYLDYTRHALIRLIMRCVVLYQSLR